MLDVIAPLYTHDCDGCKFLGALVKHGFRYDLWYCARCDEGSLIARFGDDGPSYASSPIAILRRPSYPRDTVLAQALKLYDETHTPLKGS